MNRPDPHAFNRALEEVARHGRIAREEQQAEGETTITTRNPYRITGVTRLRASGRVVFALQIGLSPPGAWHLSAEEFTALVDDLGLRPTAAEATEYASAERPLYTLGTLPGPPGDTVLPPEGPLDMGE